MTRRLRPRGDRGAAVTGVMATVAVALIALLLLAVVPLLSGTEQKARAQTAADAAALAGATSVRDRAAAEVRGVRLVDLALGELSGSWRLSTSVTPMSGFNAAADYAWRNAGVLDPTRYAYDAPGGRVRTEVELRELAPNDEHAAARARAELGLDLPECRFDAGRKIVGWTTPPPTPSPPPPPPPPPGATPTPTPTPSPTPPPPPFVSTPIYGPWGFTFECPGDRGFTESGASFTQVRDRAAAQLHDRARPRLVP